MTFRICSLTALGLTLAVVSTTFATAQEKSPQETAKETRQAHMHLYAFNIGPLVGMAKGEVDYDADTAAAAAANLSHLAQVDQGRYWPEGSSTEDLDKTRALPALFENREGLAEKQQALIEATAALDESAGEGLDQLRAAIGPVGKACGGCHETYRKSDE